MLHKCRYELLGSLGATVCGSRPGANFIGDEGVYFLVKIPSFNNLYADSNYIGDKGAVALAKNTRLQDLTLSDNNIGDEGALALSATTTYSS